ncbi:hypothetical protein CIK05_04325 [Bdellovibrio sp. qaytius]|nr:hypothetical protein CIK05_04325 [Bdellovibrio sp. qaytius]
MCSVYGISTQYQKLKDLGISVAYSDGEINARFTPYSKVPVVVSTAQGLKLTPMNYSLVPAWSKEPKAKFATHNARIETITEKPAWREPFANKHCLIPMTYFCESAYQGPHAGHIISFSRESGASSETSPLMFAAGLFDVWINPETKEPLYSCAIITTEPSQFILENGHDRTPIFLNFEDAKIWLNLINKPEKEMVTFLLSKNVYPDLHVTRDRPLKQGWEKRI